MQGELYERDKLEAKLPMLILLADCFSALVSLVSFGFSELSSAPSRPIDGCLLRWLRQFSRLLGRKASDSSHRHAVSRCLSALRAAEVGNSTSSGCHTASVVSIARRLSHNGSLN
jgi:hypothetical protein